MILYLLFLLSGASGLIYQIVWVRQFGNVFGNTIHSAALVIAVFMLGLGVGGWLAGIYADRRWAASGSLLRSYGMVELAIAALGFLMSLVLPRLGDVAASLSWYVRGADGWYALSAGSYLARYLAAVLLLTPSTLLMGGTLTLLIRYRVQRDLGDAGWRIAALYGVNTAGAALGCFLTDWVFVPNAGLAATQMIAVVFNLIAGLGALRLAGAETPAASPAPAKPAAPAGAGAISWALPVSIAITMSGFVAMAMEIVWVRHLSSLLGSYRAVLSLTLTVVLIGIWLGALVGGWLQRRLGRAPLLYALAQMLFVVTALIGLARADIARILEQERRVFPTFVAAPDWFRDLIGLWIQMRPIMAELALPAVLLGFAYPLANACIQDTERLVGHRAGLLYLANTVGAVTGALATGFVLLPMLGMQGTVTLLVVVALLGLLPLFLTARGMGEPTAARWPKVGLAVSAAGMIAGLGAWMALPNDHLIDRTINLFVPGERRLAVSEGLTEVVAITETPDGARRLITDGHPMSGTAWMSQRYMRAFAHIPLLSMEAPADVLVICFGVGNTAHAASIHPSVRRIDVVDTSQGVLDHARWFEATNGNILHNPKVRVFVNDGRHHLRMEKPASYDLITLEPPPIALAGVASLYSREFYELARSRLKRGGYLTQWLPAYQVPEYTTLALVRAFLEVFPTSVLLSGSTNELILMGVNGSTLEIDPARVKARIAAVPALRDDLARASLATLTEIIGTFAASAPTLAAAAERSIPMTDDYPINEYILQSRLRHHLIPANLFEIRPVVAVGDWCPRCFDGGRPVAGLEMLPIHLRILSRLYSDPSYLESAWPRPGPRSFGALVPPDKVTQQTIAASRYLQFLLEAAKRDPHP
ncbi:MAG TPA: hypothetical protein VID04_12140 [Methylomirabilota bacterium]